MNDFRRTIDIKTLGTLLGVVGKPMSRNAIKRRMETDPDFPQPFDDGYRLQFYEDESVAYKESRPRRQYVADGPEAAAAR